MSDAKPVAFHLRPASQQYAPLDIEMGDRFSGARNAAGGERKIENLSTSPASQEKTIKYKFSDVNFKTARENLRKKYARQRRCAINLRRFVYIGSTALGTLLVRTTGAAGAVGANNTYVPPIEGMKCPVPWNCDVNMINMTRAPYNSTLDDDTSEAYDFFTDGRILYNMDDPALNCPGDVERGMWNRVVNRSKLFEGKNATLIIPCTTLPSDGACPNGPSARRCVDAGNTFFGMAIGGGTALMAAAASPKMLDGQRYVGYGAVIPIIAFSASMNLMIDACDSAVKRDYKGGPFGYTGLTFSSGFFGLMLSPCLICCVKGVSFISEETLWQLSQKELERELKNYLPEELSAMTLEYVGPQQDIRFQTFFNQQRVI